MSKINLENVITVYRGSSDGVNIRVEWDSRTGAVRVNPEGYWMFPDVSTVVSKWEVS